MVQKKEIKGLEGRYEIWSDGTVWSLITNKKLSPYLSKSKKNNIGYMRIKLTDANGIRKDYFIHRLVAEHFIPNPENKTQVNHIDENTLNNEMENLEWMTPKENINYGNRTKKASLSQTNGKKSKIVYMCDKDTHKILKEFPSVNEAYRQTGCSNISSCCLGKLKQAGGYYWTYNK